MVDSSNHLSAMQPIRFFISSPSDVRDERKIVLELLQDLNHSPFVLPHFALRALAYEETAPAKMGNAPQSIIDEYMRADACEVYIGILWHRMGTPTTDPTTGEQFLSGTEYEFRKAYVAYSAAGKPLVLLYRCRRPIPQDADEEQWALVKQFWGRCGDADKEYQGLPKAYETLEDFKKLVEHDIAQDPAPLRDGSGPPSVELQRARDPRGLRTQYQDLYLPVDPNELFPLNRVFQGLQLRRDPLHVDKLSPEERRALLGEKTRAVLDPRWDSHHDMAEASSSQLRETEADPIVVAESGSMAVHLSASHRLAILGGPGTGKTTLLQQLILEAIEAAQTDIAAPMPIFLRLPEFAQSGKTLPDMLVEIAKHAGADETHGRQLWQAIESGQAFVCLDSLDEVPSELRSHLIDQINTWGKQGGNTWIVSSRYTEYKGRQFDQGNFAEWELLALDAPRRSALATHLIPLLRQLLYRDTPPHVVLASTFVRLLEEHPHASAWGDNPLLFSLAAYVYVKGGTLPVSRAALYQEVIDATLHSRETRKNRAEVVRRALAEVSLNLYLEKSRTFTYAELFDAIPIARKRLEEAWATEDMATWIIGSGLVDQVANGTYGFRHQTFQEYFVALALTHGLTQADKARGDKTKHFIRNKSTRTRWTEVLCLMVGILLQQRGAEGRRAAQAWLENLAAAHISEDGDPGYLSLRLAIQSLEEIQDRLQGDANPGLKRIAERILVAWVTILFNESRRGNAHLLKVLKTIRFPNGGHLTSTSPLLRLLSDGIRENSAVVRITALWVYGQLGISEPLIQGISDHDFTVRRAALEALGQLGERAPVEPLAQAADDDDSSVRRAAIQALGGLGERAPLELLVQALGDRDSSVREAAIWALGRQGEHTPLELLVQALGDRNLAVREAAIQAVGRQGERAPLELLVQALGDRDSRVRHAAIWAVGRRGDHAPLELLVQAANDDDVRVRRAAILALGQQGERVPLELLVQAADDYDSSVRHAAIQAVGRLGERAPLEPLVQAADDDDSRVREAAILALGQLGERAPLEPLVQALGDGYAGVRHAAIRALARRGDHAPLELLVQALGDRNLRVRQAAIQVVGRLGERAPLEPLVQAADDDDSSVREAAILALGQLGGSGTSGAARAGAGRSYTSRVRRAAIQAVGRLREASASGSCSCERAER